MNKKKRMQIARTLIVLMVLASMVITGIAAVVAIV